AISGLVGELGPLTATRIRMRSRNEEVVLAKNGQASREQVIGSVDRSRKRWGVSNLLRETAQHVPRQEGIAPFEGYGEAGLPAQLIDVAGGEPKLVIAVVVGVGPLAQGTSEGFDVAIAIGQVETKQMAVRS